LAHGLDRYKRWSQSWEGVNPVYPYLYPQFLAKLLLAGGMAAVVLASLRWRDPAAGTGRLFGALLLLSATVYPWYLLWVLPWAALRRHTAWLALSALILLSYLPQFAGVPLWPWVYLGIWGPFGVLLIVARPARALTPWPPLPPPPTPLPGRGGTQSEGSYCLSPSSPGEGGGVGAGEEGRGDEGLGRGRSEGPS
ncbi:MAG TPA: hypothetical protein VFC23_17655, partial [Thermoanaerobaculia bacterium]|nr:hypothetical protein [Thermoanaerobaculia bacterium]